MFQLDESQKNRLAMSIIQIANTKTIDNQWFEEEITIILQWKSDWKSKVCSLKSSLFESITNFP